MRKPDAVWYGPIEHRRNHCARLADEGDISRRCCHVRKCGVEPKSRYYDADAIWTHNAQKIGLCRVQGGLLQRTTSLTQLTETGGDDHRGPRSTRTQLGDQTWHRLGRRDDDREVRGLRQARDISVNR